MDVTIEINQGASAEAEAPAAEVVAVEEHVKGSCPIDQVECNICNVGADLRADLATHLTLIASTSTAQELAIAAIEAEKAAKLAEVRAAKVAANDLKIAEQELIVAGIEAEYASHIAKSQLEITTQQGNLDAYLETRAGELSVLHMAKLVEYTKHEEGAAAELEALKAKRGELVTATQGHLFGIENSIKSFTLKNKAEIDAVTVKAELDISEKAEAIAAVEAALKAEIADYVTKNAVETTSLTAQLEAARQELTVAIAHKVHMEAHLSNCLGIKVKEEEVEEEKAGGVEISVSIG